MKKILLLLAIATVLFAFQEQTKKERTYESQKVALHGGKVWTSSKVSKDGKPEQVSIVLDDATLNSVPKGQPSDHFSHANNLMIPVRSESGSPFQFVMVNWHSSGHEPDSIYGLPHFDFHFYTSAEADVMNYMDSVKLNKLPSSDYVPANHVAVHPLPMMGNHFIDVTSSELHGAKFTQTFIYGSYDSKVVFYEPMITLDFLKNTKNFERAIPQPTKFQQAGYYPTKLKVSRHDGVTEIILSGFEKQQAS
jgi:hypothetical protein